MSGAARYAVVGASSGTGREIVRLLASAQASVRAISRHPQEASEFVEPFAADVTQAEEIAFALEGNFDAVFYTVDIHGAFLSRVEVRNAVYQGLVNVSDALAQAATTPKLVVLSPIGPEQTSWVWTMLGMLKPGIRQAILDREAYLKERDVPHVLCRAPRLTDELESTTTVKTISARHRLDMKRTVSRRQLAQAMIDAARSAASATAWDIYADEKS